MIQKLGDQIHKKLIQYLHNRSAPSISDPVCRFLIHMFQNSPQLKFVVDKSATSRSSFYNSSFNKRRQNSLGNTMQRSRISFLGKGSGSMQSQTSQVQAMLMGGVEDNQDQIPFYKKIKYVNRDESEFANFKATCFQEGLLQEVAMMLAPNRPPPVVYSGIKLASFFVSKTEIPILLKELDSLTIF